MGHAGKRPEVSIVILSHNHWDYTVTALNSLTMTRDVSFETILVDNGSVPPVREAIAEYHNTGINYQYVFNDTNIGIASGRNQGASIAKGHSVLFLDNDVRIIHSDWLKNLLCAMRAHPSIGVGGGILLRPSGEPQFAGGRIDSKGNILFSEKLNADDEFDGNVVFTEFCIGACMLVSKSCWDQLGGFDTLFDPMDYEDIDFCLRAREMGWQSGVVPQTKLIHTSHVTTGKNGLADFRRLKNFLINGRRFKKRWRHYFDRPTNE